MHLIENEIFLADSSMIVSSRVLLIDGLSLISLISIALLGDCLCFGRPWSFHVLSHPHLRALTDNFTHGLISVLATAFLFGYNRYFLLAFAFIAGSFVDVDHVNYLLSLFLHRPLHDQPRGRGFLHNSLLLLSINLIVLTLEYTLSRPHYIIYSVIFFLGWSTHHLRDAQRHGLTFLPLGETPPIDHYLPIMCLILVLMKFSQTIFPTRQLTSTNFSIV